MMEGVKNLIKVKDHYYLIGVYSIKDYVIYKFIEVSIEADNLKIVNNETFFCLNDFKALLKKDFPVILHFDGDNVISKATKNEQGYRNNIVFKTNPDDFHFYEYHQDNQIFASLTRKQIIEDKIKQLNSIDKYVVHISIGPFVLSQLFSIIEENTNELFSFAHCLKLNSGGIESFEKTETKTSEISISDQQFNQNEISLIASFLEYKQENDKIKFEDDFLSNNKNEQLYRRRFKLMSVFTIVFIMLILFIGHQLLSSYINSLAEKESRYSISQQTLMQVNELREEQQLKEKILESSGVIDSNYLTRYFVEIGNVIPESVTINTIDIAPVLKKIKPNESILINPKTITINGESNNDDDFNTMIKNMKTISWVKKIDISSYIEDKSGNIFTVEIKK